MNNTQAAHRMSEIILPGDTKIDFLYFVVIGMTGIKTAMVKFPKSLEKPFERALQENEENRMLWFITERRDEVDEDGLNDASRYQLRGFVFKQSMIQSDITPQEFNDFIIQMESESPQDGYVYFPKVMRDGKHDARYIPQPIEADFFTTRTERGMFEEVAWSPFGSIDEATKQEAQNLERNPLMRHWT